MSSRPEILFPLFSDITKLAGIGEKTAKTLERIGINTPRDLLLTLPQGVINRQPVETLQAQKLPAIYTVAIEVLKHIPNSAKNRPYRILVKDSAFEFYLSFFHPRIDWLKKSFPVGGRRVVSGKVDLFDHTAQIVHPDFVVAPDAIDSIPQFEPVYPLTQGITQKLMFKSVADALTRVPELPEWLDLSVLNQREWASFKESLQTAHRPKGELPRATRDRLTYDELLSHQLTLAIARAQNTSGSGISTSSDGSLGQAVLKSLPFEPTNAQIKAIEDIQKDLKSHGRMNRLLQGDVGSGKTLVALMAMLYCAGAGAQAALMAPTGILARQHFAGLSALLKDHGVKIELLTGADKGASRREKLKALENGDIQILIGTHALFSDDVEFNDLRFVVIDEQHRFGVRQRLALSQKADKVDVLVMTATPIPRSLELAHYGDMDVSILDEKPKGRKPIETAMVAISQMDRVVDRLKLAIRSGKQAYWVCPLVDESEEVDLAAATDRAAKLSAEIGAGSVGLVHGRMSQQDKDDAMRSFVEGQTKVLVATTVIEVGVDVPNATIIVIEQAERFGLAQLHQLRGRVGRGQDQSACLLLYKHPLGKTAQRRLEAIRNSEDGFELAEIDLSIRGAGDLLGTQQAGLPKFRIADLEQDTELMKMARDEARMILDRDPKLDSDRGKALRTLLYLMGADEYIKLLKVG